MLLTKSKKEKWENIRYSSYSRVKVHKVGIEFVPSVETCTRSAKL